MNESHGDLVLSHVTYDVELSDALLWDDLVGYPLQVEVESLEEIFKQQGK